MNREGRPRKAGRHAITTIQRTRPTVAQLRSRSTDPAQQRALAAIHHHLVEARVAIDAALASDIDMVFTAHLEVTRAMGVTLDNRLATRWPPFPTRPSPLRAS